MDCGRVVRLLNVIMENRIKIKAIDVRGRMGYNVDIKEHSVNAWFHVYGSARNHGILCP